MGTARAAGEVLATLSSLSTWKASMAVNWNAPADVEPLIPLQPRRPGAKITAPKAVFSGTLLQCFNYVDARPSDEKLEYTILPSLLTGLQHGSYTHQEIEALDPPRSE